MKAGGDRRMKELWRIQRKEKWTMEEIEEQYKGRKGREEWRR